MECLEKIFSLLYKGEDLNWITNETSRKWAEAHQTRVRAGGLAERLGKDCPLDALDVISQMLKMNPARRISVKDALKHRFFKDFRDFRLEKIAEKKLDVAYEDKVTTKEALKSSVFFIPFFHKKNKTNSFSFA